MKKTTIITVLFALITLALSYFFYSLGASQQSELITPEPQSETIEKQSQILEAQYVQKYDSLELVNIQLKQNLDSIELKLSSVKTSRKTSEKKVIELSDAVKLEQDELAKLEVCDALVQEFDKYIEISIIEDKLNLMTIDRLKRQVSVKDSFINIQSKELNGTKALLDESIKTQRVLEKEIKKRDRKLKRQKLKTKVVSFGGVVITTVLVTLLIQKK